MEPTQHIYKFILRSLSVFFFCCVSLFVLDAQVTDSLKIYFRVGSAEYDPNYRGNRERMDSFIKRVYAIEQDSLNYTIYQLEYLAAASLEGTPSFNQSLSERRFSTVLNYMKKHLDVSGMLEVSDAVGEDWERIIPMVQNSNLSNKEELLSIFRDSTLTQEQKKSEIKKLNKGKVWNYLLRRLYPELRYCEVTVHIGEVPQPRAWVHNNPIVFNSFANVAPVAQVKAPLENKIIHNIQPEPVDAFIYSIKTNAVALGMLIANIAGEIRYKQFSFNLPIMFSAIDYFAADTKFRVLSFQPEFRWWVPKTNGFFLGAHFGMGWDNIAANGNWRYQDHNGDCPSIGGGIGDGYKLPIALDGRLNIEFELGAGVYHVNYDTFYNEPNGPLANTTEKIYIGLDNVSISLSYDFRVFKKDKK